MSASYGSEGSPNDAPRRYRRLVQSAMGSIIVCLLAMFGGLILIGMTVFVLRMDVFGRIAADQILANAIRPSGREMPATAGSIPYASADTQIVGGMGQGLSCSLPGILEWLAFPTHGDKSPIGLRMRQACAYHDYCYRHGAATYGYTQADCDFALQAQAFRLCTFIENVGKPDENGHVKDSNCMQDARLVTLGVRVGGSDSFRTHDARFVPSIEETDRDGSNENSSTFFEFDLYATKSTTYTVYRIADAPLIEHKAPGTKAIYRFKIRPSGTAVSYSLGFQPYKYYAQIPGNPNYLTSAPLVVGAGFGDSAADWFVWWQRASEDATTGRLIALAPGVATDTQLSCFESATVCLVPALHTIVAEIGRAENWKDDPQIDQLRPADLGPASTKGISLITLRNHSCLGPVGNAPCFVHVLVRTDKAAGQPQPQEPLSINDRFSRKPESTDNNRYRNFVSLPFVLNPPNAKSPAIAWTRRDENYQDDAYLRRAAVDPGRDEKNTIDDTASSQGTVFLSGFAEADEPAFVIGRSTNHPILVSITDATDTEGASATAARLWEFPPPDIGDQALSTPAVAVDAVRCRPGVEATWLLRPPQIVGRSDESSLVVFTRLRPHVSKDWMAAKLQVTTLVIQPDGSCPAPAWRGPEIPIRTSKPTKPDEIQDPIERGRNAFIRVSKAPILVTDIDGDGSTKLILPQGSEPDSPLQICSLTTDGMCVPSDNSNGG